MKRRDFIAPLARFDIFVLFRVAQPAVDFCSLRWGWDFVKLGQRLCEWALAAYALTALWITWMLLSSGVWAGVSLGALVLPASVFIAYPHYINATRAIRVAKMTPNLNTVMLFPHRIGCWSWVLVCLFLPGGSWQITTPMLLVAGYYTLSCLKPPPKEQRVSRLAPEAA